MDELELTDEDGGTTITVRAQTRSDRNAILAVRDVALLVAVTEPPEKGKANRAIRKTLAKRLGLAKGDLTIVSGERGRDKRIHLAGVSAADVRDRLDLRTDTS